jgi:hypothetical protein
VALGSEMSSVGLAGVPPLQAVNRNTKMSRIGSNKDREVIA